MMEMSCRWWPIWYLLFFCHGAEGQLQWIVKEKVTDYGQDLTLFCPIGNCCSEPPGWFVGPKTIILDVRTFSNDPKVKYHGTYDTDGFGVVIRNLSEADLNVTYSCIYGFNQSIPKYLFHGDVFKEKKNVDESCNNTEPPDQCKDPMSSCTEVVSGDYKCSCNPGYYNNGGTCNIQINVDESCYNTRSPDQCKDPMSSCTGDYKCSCKPGYYNNGGTCVPDKDKDKENNTVAIVLAIVVPCILVGAMIIAYFVYRSRIKKKRPTPTVPRYPDTIQNEQGTDMEMEPLNDSKNQQGMLTRRAREGVDALEKNKIILLTGIDGIGKTFTAKEIIKLYCGRHHDFNKSDQSNLYRLQVKPHINYFLSDRFQTYGKKCIVFMDDFLANHYVKYLKEDLDILKMVYRTKHECPGTVEVVLTVDNSCIEWWESELQQCGLLSAIYVIDLNKGFNKTEDLQKQLLKVYLPGEEHLYRDIVEKYRTAQEPKIGFPELCYLFSKNQIFRDQGADFFQDPSISLGRYFMKLGSNTSSKEENVFYIALVQIMMTNKLVVFNISRAEIENMQKMFNILYKKTLDVQSLERIIDTTNCGILIKTSENRDGMYVFQNPLILNFLFNSFDKIISQFELEDVLGFFTMEFIVGFVRTPLNHQSIYPNTEMVVKEESYPLLAVRIREIIDENGKDSVDRLCLSPLLDNKMFLHILLNESGKQTESRSSDYSGGNDVIYFPAALLDSVMKYRPSTGIVNIVLDDMSTTLRLQSHPDVVRTCHRSVKFSMTEACKENCIEQIKILGRFITEHNIDYSGSSFLREAFINQGNEAVTWILDNIPIPHTDVLSILLHLGNERKLNKDSLEYCIEHIYPVEHNTSRHELNKFNIYESIEYFCQQTRTLDIVKYMWTSYKDRIIRNYCALFPDIEESVVLGSVLGKFMTASQKMHDADLIRWWVDTEGTRNFNMEAVKTYMRSRLMEIPGNWSDL